MSSPMRRTMSRPTANSSACSSPRSFERIVRDTAPYTVTRRMPRIATARSTSSSVKPPCADLLWDEGLITIAEIKDQLAGVRPRFVPDHTQHHPAHVGKIGHLGDLALPAKALVVAELTAVV